LNDFDNTKLESHRWVVVTLLWVRVIWFWE